jgi:hypothetical protein
MVPPFSCNTRFKGGWKMKNRSIILQAVKHLSESFFAKNKCLTPGKSAILAFSVATILLFNGCESLPEGPDNIWNELDPASPDYVKPKVTFMAGPDAGSTISTSDFEFIWTGNQTDMTFRFRLDDEAWTNFLNTSSATYSYIDDGPHRFQIQAAYSSGSTGDTTEIPFTVDAVQAPALYFFPRQNTAMLNQSLTLTLYLEIADSAAGVNAVLQYDPARLRVDGIALPADHFFSTTGSEMLTFFEDDGNGLVNISVVAVNGNPRKINGNEVLVQLQMTSLQTGNTVVAVTADSELRDDNNNPLPLTSFFNALIMVQ